ncbi:MAG: RNA-binding transcriptional accessory protein [Bdellovibrionaceae bacterium]|jgi:protein Tex|nr:RNA-binding transcriptional accessory protein [Pseudobdellovibrionaceae bacterium]
MDTQFQNYMKKKLPSVPLSGVKAVLTLAEEGGTIPFIARYRKEKTGNLDEIQIRDVIDLNNTFKEILHRKEFVLSEIAKQGNLTDDLEKQIKHSDSLIEIEELYRPFKKKKKTKAKIAKDAGIEPLANWIWQIGHGEIEPEMTLEVKAKEFQNTEAGFVTYEEILRGAQHIIVENLSNNADLRKTVRENYLKTAEVHTAKGLKFKAPSKYEMYAEYKDAYTNLLLPKNSHRYLALRRGWQETELKVSISSPEDEALLKSFEAEACNEKGCMAEIFLNVCAKTALQVHVLPSITNELHKILKETADVHAINVFSENLKNVLMSSPFGAKVVLGIDPGLRTGCKMALLDKNGQYISHTVLHTLGDKAKETGLKLFSEVIKQIKIEAIAVGNGTAGRETEAFVRDILKDLKETVPVVLVNESGASIYSASDIAREEFPDLDLTVRGAIFIARRLRDPLAELVKLEPKSIGVGQYQHDVSKTHLQKSLHEVVEFCVNGVGVDINTASPSLLQYVSGVGPAIAKNIVEYRSKNGFFKSKKQIMEVPRFSEKVFEQGAGFLRILDGENPLDQTGIHPERYKVVQDIAKELGTTQGQLIGQGKAKVLPTRAKWAELVGEYTFDDIVKELDEPGRDPRDPFKVFEFRADIHELKDLKEDMVCPGLVTNVTNFGAFVDIGVHQDGLVHISELSAEFIDDPKKVVSPGDQVQIKVLKIDLEKKQLSLSMLVGEKAKRPQRDAKKQGAGKGAGDKKNSKAPRNFKKGDNKNKTGKGKGPHKGTKHAKPVRPPKPKFNNNPFGDLAGLKLK